MALCPNKLMKKGNNQNLKSAVITEGMIADFILEPTYGMWNS